MRLFPSMRLRTTAAWVALISAQLVGTGVLAAARQPSQPETAAPAEPSRPASATGVEGAESAEEWLERAIDAYGRGEIGLAAEAFSRAGAYARSANDEAAAAAAFNNASVLWNEAGRYEAALEAARAAVELRTGETDAATARALNSLGLSLLNLGRYDESAVELRRALVLNRELGEAEGEVVNLTNLAIAAERRGDFHVASRELSSALAVLERQGTEPWAADRRNAALLNLGVLRERLGDYRGALGVLAPLEATADAGGAPRERAVLEQNLAVVYRNLGDPLEALARLERAEQLYRSAGDEAGAAGVLLNVGIVRYVDLEDAGAALRPLETARELAAALGERGLEAEASFHLGRAHTLAGDDGAARRELERSFALASAAGAGEVRWQARWGLALLEERAGNLDAALDQLRAALDEVDAVRASLRGAGERGTYFADKRAVYAAAARVLLRLADGGRAGAAEEALQVAWRAKSRLLLDAMGSGAASVDAATKAPPAVGAVQARLGDELLLEYLLAGDRLFRVLVDERKVVVEDRGDAATVLRDVRMVHESLAGGAPPPLDAVARLSRVLLAGAWPGEPPGEPSRRVAIAGDGLLRYLPFELLETVPAGPPLVESTTVRYLPSGAFAGAPPGGSAAPTTLRAYALAEAASDAGTPIENETSDVFELQVRRLPALAAADLEVRLAAAALGGRAQLRTGDEASETNFRRDAADRARVLHLATHAVLSEDRGGAAALVLRADGEHDGLLRAAELADLRLDVDLALLSACSTTFGAADDARALESLSGAFLRAGARGVVATLWDVADEDAAAFVEAFAWELGHGRDAAEALRRVKRRFRDDPRWASPTHWAGFVLIGASPVVRPAVARWRRALFPALLAAIAVAAATLLAARRAQGQSRKVSKSSSGPG